MVSKGFLGFLVIIFLYTSYIYFAACNNKTLELLFLLDSSGNIGHTNFEILKTFVKYVIEQFDISENKTRVGLMTYSRYPFIRFALREDMNTSLVLNAVDNIPYIAGNIY